MNTDRIKEIQYQTGSPHSVSVYQALLQVWNECYKDNKDKKYTEEDMIDAIIYGSSLTTCNIKLYAHNYINSLNKQD